MINNVFLHYRIVDLLRKKFKIMAKTFSELQALVLQIRDEILEKKNTAPRVGAALLDMIDNTIQNITDINQKLSVFEHVCSGFKRVESESQLPVTPPQDEKAVGYLVGKNLYLYVEEGGNAVDGRYFNVGDITGPQGETGPQGIKGDKGDKGEQGNSGVSGSTDNIEVVNNLEGGESTPERIKVLAAEQGKVLNGKFSEVEFKAIKFSETKNLVPTEEQIYFTTALINNNKASIEIISEAVFTKLNVRIDYADETPTEYKSLASVGFHNIESDSIIKALTVYVTPNQITQPGNVTINIYRNTSYDIRTALNDSQKNTEDIKNLGIKTDEAMNGIDKANKRITTLSYQIATLDVAGGRYEGEIYDIKAQASDSPKLIVNHGNIKSLKVTLPALYSVTVILQLVKKDTNEVVSITAAEATKIEDYVYTYEIDNLDDYIYIRPVIYPQVFDTIDKEITDELFQVEITYKDNIVYLNPFLYSEYNYYLSYLFKEIFLDLSSLTEYNIEDLEYIKITRVEVIDGYLKQIYFSGHFTGLENDIMLFSYYVNTQKDKTTDFNVITLESPIGSLLGKGYIVFNKNIINEFVNFGKNGILKDTVRDSINSPYIYTKKYVIEKLANNSTVNPQDVINIVKSISSSDLDLDSEDNVATAKAVYLLKTLIDELSLNSKVR